MKGKRCLRGYVADNELRRLIVDDSNFNDGWRITKFVVAGDGINSNEVHGKLSLKPVTTTGWDWSKNTEIAWAAARQTAEATWGGWEGAIDPNAVIVQDLYVIGSSSAGSVINYLIEIERVTLNDDQAILSLIQERAQDDL
tara:strand:+ start:703 stop:1125 length:423 start_codon:yes stop_codon:yes gene_type:complete